MLDGRNLAQPRVSIVLPTLNEARNPEVLLPDLDERYEVVLVDGGSTDDTIEVARDLIPDVRVLQQTRRGKGSALVCGMHADKSDIVVTLDADGSRIRARSRRSSRHSSREPTSRSARSLHDLTDQRLRGVDDLVRLALPVRLLAAVRTGRQRDDHRGGAQAQLGGIDTLVEDRDPRTEQAVHPLRLPGVHALHSGQVRDKAGQVVGPASGADRVDVENPRHVAVADVDLTLVEVTVGGLVAFGTVVESLRDLLCHPVQPGLERG